MKRSLVALIILQSLFVVSNGYIENEKVDLLMEKILALENTVHLQNTKMNALEKSNTKLEKVLLEKSERIAYLEDAILELQRNVMHMTEPDTSSSVSSNKTVQLEKSIRIVREPYFPLKNHREDRLLSPPTTAPDTVGFYAVLSRKMETPGTHHTIIFDSVKTNIGNGYNGHTGVFTAPASGLYGFTWSMRLFGNEHHSAQLIVNSVVHGAVFLSVNGGNENVSGTGLVYLNVGDDVLIRTTADNLGNIESDTSGLSIFGGWLIK